MGLVLNSALLLPLQSLQPLHAADLFMRYAAELARDVVKVRRCCN